MSENIVQVFGGGRDLEEKFMVSILMLNVALLGDERGPLRAGRLVSCLTNLVGESSGILEVALEGGGKGTTRSMPCGGGILKEQQLEHIKTSA